MDKDNNKTASKRSADAAGSSSGLPPAKKLLTQFEPVKIGPVYSLVSFLFNYILKMTFTLLYWPNCNFK